MVVCYDCNKFEHYSTNCPEPRKQGYNLGVLLCGICKREGHAAANCPVGGASKTIMRRADGAQPPAAKAPGETAVNYVGMEWQEEGEEQENSAWEFQSELPGTDTPIEEEHCYKVTTRSNRRKEKKDQTAKVKKTKQTSPKPKTAPEQDSDYKRDHPRLFFPKVNEEVKKQLEELETLEHEKALSKDLQTIKLKAAVEEEKTKVEAAGNALVVSYDIKKDVKDCPVTATVGQLIKDNPLYRKQLKEMLAGKRRRKLPKVGTVADVRMLYEDHGSPKIDIQN